MVSEKALKKFKELYEQRFKEELNDDEALRKATRLLNLYRVIYGASLYETMNNNQLNKMKINPNENDYVNEKQIINNLEKCPHFNKCSQNLCPVDLEIYLRSGKEQDKCRWMRESKKKKINGREFISGGRVMPNGILKFVPESNLKWLNESSRKRWLDIKK